MNIIGIVGGLFLAAFYIAAAFYIGWRLFKWLEYIFDGISSIAFTFVFVLLVALSLKAMIPMSVPIPFNYVLRSIGGHLIGFFMYLLIFFVLADLFNAIARAIFLIPLDTQRVIRFRAGLAAIVLTFWYLGMGL
ncbi:MAG: hypothetical protein FWE42_08380 [Defluviitaleaceae bacterium]|nr:hypothetical protein [Defluviitaleaceae bacterium]